MAEEVTRYRCSWTTPNGDKVSTGDQWFSTEEHAWTAFKLFEKWVSESADKESAQNFYNADCKVTVETTMVKASDWPTANGVVVYLEEEYGYRTWLWHTQMTADELLEWWKNLSTVSPYFFSPVGLPGVVLPADWGSRSDEGITTLDPDSELKEDGDGDLVGTEMFYRWPTKNEDYWFAHLHQDDDSVLIRGREDDRVSFHHAGYDAATLEEIESNEDVAKD